MKAKPVRVSLSWHEVSFAAQVGITRQLHALRDSRPDAFGRGAEEGWSDHIEGACGELAAAKALAIYWEPTVNTFKTGGDVGRHQVRTRSRSDYQLLVRQSDPDDALFILVRGRAPSLTVVGWMRGRDAKRAEWSKTHGGRPAAFFVPDDELQDIANIRDTTTSTTTTSDLPVSAIRW